MSRPVVNKWRQRFRVYGMEGLPDAPRSGKPVIITAAQKAMVIQKACEKPTGGYTNWSQERIAKQVGISQSKVHQILKQADLKPHVGASLPVPFSALAMLVPSPKNAVCTTLFCKHAVQKDNF